MNNIDAAAFAADLRKLACELGVKLDACKDSGQLSSGAHLVCARDEIFAALRSFNPKIDERQLSLGGVCET